MTYQNWENELLGYLKSLPNKEKKEIIEYYREIYGDKSDAGMSCAAILATFGKPQLCAAKILMERSEADDSGAAKANAPCKQKEKPVSIKGTSPARIIGGIFLFLILVIPITAVMFSIVVSFGAVSVAGAATAAACIIAAIVAIPAGLIIGWSGVGIFATLGAAIVGAGVGALLVVVFTPLTKYTAIAFWNAIKIFYGRRKQ